MMSEPDAVTRPDLCPDTERVARGVDTLLDEETSSRLAEVFRALADPTRARIICCLLRQELCTCDLAEVIGITEPSVSQHLRLLRGLRLVRTRREGRRVYYALDDDHVRQLISVSLSHLSHPEPAEVTDGVAAGSDGLATAEPGAAGGGSR